MKIKFLNVKFTRELSTIEKHELMTMYQGHYFNLQEVLQNGMRILVKIENSKLNNFDIEKQTVKKYKKYGCTFE